MVVLLAVEGAIALVAAQPVVVGVLVLVLLLLVYACYTPKDYPPSVGWVMPLLQGKLELEKTGPTGLIKRGYDQVGGIFRLKFGYRGVTFFVGPKAHAVFCTAKDSELGQQEVYNFTVPVFGKGVVFDSPANIFVQQLKFLRTGLNTNALNNHVGNIISEAQDFFSKWPDEQKELNILTTFSELIIMTASRCILGSEIRERMHTSFSECFEELSSGMVHLSFFLPHAPIAAHRKRDQAREKMTKLFGEALKATRAAKGTDQENTDHSFLSILLASKYRDGTELTDKDILGILLAALFGGQHTSNITSTWLGIQLCQPENRSIWDRLVKEQEQVIEEEGDCLGLRALHKMELLGACVLETLRLYPPLIMLLRKVKKDLKYKGYTIPKGDIAAVCPPVANRLDTVFTNPDKFDPDRWLAPRNEHEKEKFTMTSFGGGRHECMGKKFGLLQVTTIYSVILRNFDLSLVEGVPMPILDYSQIVVGPKHENCLLNVRRRKLSGGPTNVYKPEGSDSKEATK